MHRLYFIGCPLFSVTLFVTAKGHTPPLPNPTDRAFFAERKTAGDRYVWLGRRVALFFEPRSHRPASPLFVVE